MQNTAAASLAALMAFMASPALAQAGGQQDDGPIATASRGAETAEALRLREAMAYAYPLPRGAPAEDYPLVAWCNALVTGHVALGESLTSRTHEDNELIRLGRLESQDFSSALSMAEARQSRGTLEAARRAAEDARALWQPLLRQEDETLRNQSFGLFFGLPGRCEHAARRIRDNITTPPATPAEVGMEEAPASGD